MQGDWQVSSMRRLWSGIGGILMAISRGARVIVKRTGVERPGVVLREVDPMVIKGVSGEGERRARYEVQMPAYRDWPPHTDRFDEEELTPVPRDTRSGPVD